MSFGRFLLLLFVKPRQAFVQGKGRFLLGSILLGIFSCGSGAYFLWMLGCPTYPVSVSPLIIASVFYFLAMSLLYHLTAWNYSDRSSTWMGFLSLFGFASVPRLLADLLLAGTIALHLMGTRDQTSPGLISFGPNWLIIAGAFSVAMGIAGYVYHGLMIKAVYGLRRKSVLVVLAVVLLLQVLFVSPITDELTHRTRLSWQTAALMLDDVRQIDLSAFTATDLESHSPSLNTGELVLIRITGLTLNGRADTELTVKSGPVLAEIMAKPGDKVELDQGSLWVNEHQLYQAETPLAPLVLNERVLGQDQYFVYFRSPETLGETFKPALLIINRSQIIGAVSDSALEFLQWLMK